MEEPAARTLRKRSFESDVERNEIYNCDFFKFEFLMPVKMEIMVFWL